MPAQAKPPTPSFSLITACYCSRGDGAVLILRRSFEPLLEAENAECRKIFMYKIVKCPLDRLEREGHALSNMTATLARFQPSSSLGRCVVEFKRFNPRGENVVLPFHLFS